VINTLLAYLQQLMLSLKLKELMILVLRKVPSPVLMIMPACFEEARMACEVV
jgi:hypothetical protein